MRSDGFIRLAALISPLHARTHKARLAKFVGYYVAPAIRWNSVMPVATLDYAPRTEFDCGLFVARYLKVLAWLSIALMIAGPIFFDSLSIDLTFIFLFWAASALKRRSQTARKWVLGVLWFSLGLLLLVLAWSAWFGTAGLRLSIGYHQIESPALWILAAYCFAVGAVLSVPFGILMSRRARIQFGTPASA